MSAPDTKLENQRKRHAGPLIGIALVLFVIALLFVYFLWEEISVATGGVGTRPNDATNAPAMQADEVTPPPATAPATGGEGTSPAGTAPVDPTTAPVEE